MDKVIQVAEITNFEKEANNFMVKKLTILGIAVLLLFSVAGLTACNRQHKVYEEGYFQYIVVGQNSDFPKNKADEGVAIIGLTESGKEQGFIDFPKTLAKKKVTHLGYRKRIGLMLFEYFHFESPNLKKIYIHDNISAIEREAFSFFDDISIMVCGTNPVFVEDSQTGFFVYKELYDEADEHYILDDGRHVYYWQKSQLTPANIVFLNNYSNEINRGYYRLDNIESGERIPQPPAPERDGRNFTGWFTEPGCLNLWDFNTAPEITENTEFKLYAGWQAK